VAFLKIISIIILLTPSVSFAGRCRHTVPIRVDSLFNEKEMRVIHRAANRWERVSKNKICFDIKVVKIYEVEQWIYRRDGQSTIYSWKAEWQKKAAIEKHDCSPLKRYAACTVPGLSTTLSADIFVVRNVKFYNLITHELGHVFGIGHSPSPRDLMYKEIRTAGKGSTISPRDRKVLRCIIKTNKLLDWKNPCPYGRFK
jgi:hypothetical protein